MTSMARLVSLAILTGLIVFLGITFYQIVTPFLLPLFLAAITAVWCQPLHGYFQLKFRGRVRVAAAATMTSVCLLLFVPLTLAIVTAAWQLKDLAVKGTEKVSATVEKLQHADQPSNDELKAQIRKLATKALDYVQPLPDESISSSEREAAEAERQRLLDEFEQGLTDAMQDAGPPLQELAMKSLGIAASGGWGLTTKTFGLLGAAVGMMIGLTMFLIAFYYFLCDGSSLLDATQKLIPVQIDYQRQLIHEFNRVMQSVVSATMLSSIAQGAATSVVLFFLGFHNFFLLFVVATFASLIPIAGTWMVWGPCAIWLWADGHHGQAIFLAIFGIAVIGTMDNVIKAYVLQSETSLHPLLAFVSVFGGMQVMGLWGIFVGPVVACCLHALVKIFNTELSEFSKERFGKTTPSANESPTIATSPATTSSHPSTTTAPPAATPANG